MAKQRESMIPGKRYRGYGYLNEFKEFIFEPEDTGSRAGVIKQICTRDGISLSESKNYLLIHIKMPKYSKILERLGALTKIYNNLVNILRDYDI